MKFFKRKNNKRTKKTVKQPTTRKTTKMTKSSRQGVKTRQNLNKEVEIKNVKSKQPQKTKNKRQVQAITIYYK